MKHTQNIARLATAVMAAGLIWVPFNSALADTGGTENTEAASLTLSISGLSPQTGAVMVGVYAGETAWDGGDAITGRSIDVSGETISVTFEGLAPGAYGLKLYHDVDGDGRMNTNLMGIPTEPVVFSNNAPMRFGPARWNDATFELSAGSNAHTVTFR